MLRKSLIIVTVSAVALMLFVGAAVVVDAGTGYIAPPAPITRVDQVKTDIICKILGWIFTLAIILSILFILIAGIRYITQGSNPEKRSEINRMIIFAAVGIAVAILARGVPSIISTFFGGSGLDPCASVFGSGGGTGNGGNGDVPIP